MDFKHKNMLYVKSTQIWCYKNVELAEMIVVVNSYLMVKTKTITKERAYTPLIVYEPSVAKTC